MKQQKYNQRIDPTVMNSNISNHPYDPMNRARAQIITLSQQNQQLHQTIQQLKTNPQQLINQTETQLLRKIRQLKQQNYQIESLIEKSIIPGYAEMTKKKVSGHADSPQRFQMRSSFEMGQRNIFDSVSMSEKEEASTCQNFQLETENPLNCLQPMQEEQLRTRTRLTHQLLTLIDKTSKIEQEVQCNQSENQPQQPSIANRKKLQEIGTYKKKLTLLLKRLREKQHTTQQLVAQYRTLHEDTLVKFREMTELLENLESAQVDEGIDGVYAEVLQLEERLRYINAQLQKLDEKQWLQQILKQLMKACRRIGIPISKQTADNQADLKSKIDDLCQKLIECCVQSQGDQKQNINLLKHYHQQQKQANKKILKLAQNKQQGLAKKLIDMQMDT